MKRAVLSLTLMAATFSFGVVWGLHHHPLKHTGPCQLLQRASAGSFWFVRPNQELFEMYFDNPPAIFPQGAKFSDIAYTDDNVDMRHFVKATVAK